ncbi:hypoxanthine phosphoribosyltransferase [Secundilactobacillus kimchicus]|uniref:Hypoxanthine phosphoribosyltransferase n=1 Tax=Secundilactobacillus kimchicus JCM 15530 TaxID=1302272 RepID=A0A0R1HK56_9LACO|nr:hypoxanthine phosphoribosyltransferase [Secundilactobacillus kimchicus]KRK47037.1 hypoxanthine-guanine phosphoribosyltransferase [Secundilactobacillus kimchicus JCM 15530]MBT9670704.1 hypoxanthine phosphoribosyltransferase [Secundilactobacillus kimchicus]
MNNDIERVLFSQEDIQEACRRLGAQISRDYEGKKPVVVGVLKGAILFMVDLIKEMDIMTEVDFLDVSSYHGGVASTGSITLNREIETDISGRHVIIVEDIIDTGLTLQYMLNYLNAHHVASAKVCTLLDKPEGRKVTAKADYVGFNVPNEFVVGYGLDYQEFYRNLPYVGVLKPDVYSE